MKTPEEDFRLNKHLALVLGISRREADIFIEQGRVKVNSHVAVLGEHFRTSDQIEVNGKPLDEKPEFQYLLLNKPVGYVSSRRQQGNNQTLYSLLPKEYHHLKPVGRLDKDSSGLILLSNDGDFTLRMTHPSYHKMKVYNILLDRDLEPMHQQMINDYGVQLEDGVSKLMLERLSDSDRLHWRIIMHEGRNRQIRRTFSALGYTIIKLHRTHFGNYSLDDIKPGKCKLVDMR
ncbi:MAG: pseudouridine synthase [Candidatus Saccharimonadales bacterium]